MADGKNIEIRIAATGGGESAAEIAKPTDAIKAQREEILRLREAQAAERAASNQSGQAGPMATDYRDKEEEARIARVLAYNKAAEEQARQFRALKAAQIEEAAAAEAAAAAEIAAAKARDTAGRAVINLDRVTLASEYGMRGVIRGAAGLVTSLGGGAGLAAAVTTAALGMQLMDHWMEKSGETAKEAAEKEKELADRITELNDQRQGRSMEAALAANKKWLEALKDEEEAILRVNTEYHNKLEVMETIRRNELAMKHADAAEELANIDADPTSTDAQKIRKRSEVQDRVDTLDYEGKIIQSKDKVTAGEIKVTESQGAETQKRKEEEQARQHLTDQIQERDELRRKVEAADVAKKSLPELQKQENDARTVGFAAAADGSFSKEDLAKLNEDYKVKFNARQAAEAAQYKNVTTADRDKLHDLDGEKDKSTGEFPQGAIGQTLEDYHKLKKEREALAGKTKDSQEELEKTRKIEQSNQEKETHNYQKSTSTRSSQTDRESRKAQDEDDKKEADADRKKKEDAESEAKKKVAAKKKRVGEDEAFAKEASGATNDYLKAGGNPQAAALVQKATTALQKNPTEQNETELLKLVERMLAHMDVLSQKAAHKPVDEARVTSLETKLNGIIAREKNKRDGN